MLPNPKHRTWGKFIGNIMEFVTFYLNTRFAIIVLFRKMPPARSWYLGAGWDPHVIFFLSVKPGGLGD